MILALVSAVSPLAAQAPAAPSGAEESDGWRLLFDGRTLAGWRGINRSDAPKCWRVEEGRLVVQGGLLGDRGDLITEEQFGNFEFAFEWRVEEKDGNSGVKYYVLEKLSKGGGMGLEYQILDTEASAKAQGKHKTASLYDLYAPLDCTPRPSGEWNEGRIVSRDGRVEHYLNGVKVLEYRRGSEEFRGQVKKSKFRNIPFFGEAPRGHLLLQDHGGTVSFRNLKIRCFDRKAVLYKDAARPRQAA